jgi:hypothetical protein
MDNARRHSLHVRVAALHEWSTELFDARASLIEGLLLLETRLCVCRATMGTSEPISDVSALSSDSHH